MSAPARLVRLWADVALAGIAVNLLVLVAAPVLRPDLNLLEKSLSYYAVGPWGALQMTAFVAIGVASAALGVTLLQARISSFWLWPIVLLLVVSGVASLAIVLYPMGAAGPSTILGDTHQTAGTIGSVAQLAAALAFTISIRADARWGDLFKIALAAFLLALAGALASQAAIWWPKLGIPMGATMRILVVPLVALWGLVALRLRRACG